MLLGDFALHVDPEQNHNSLFLRVLGQAGVFAFHILEGGKDAPVPLPGAMLVQLRYKQKGKGKRRKINK